MSNVATTQETTKNSEAVKNEEAKKVIPKIEVTEKLKFDANIKSCFINTIELASIVDGLFADAMRDYVGCKIGINNGNLYQHQARYIPMGKPFVSLFFKDRSKSGDNCPIKNVVLRSESRSKSKFDSLKAMSGVGAGRTYDVTPETYEALNEFAFATKVDWNALTSEIPSTFGFSGLQNQEPVVCITGLDLEKIINAIYGTRTEEGIFQYQAVPVQIVANVSGEYVMQITQLDMGKLNDLRKQLGGAITPTEYHQCIR